MIVRAIAALAVLIVGLLAASGATAQQRVYHGQSWATHDLSYTECTSRAKTAIANAARIFGLAGQPQNFTFFVGLEWDGSAVLNVYCLSSLVDTRAPPDLEAVGPMLTGIVVSTTRPIDVNLILQMLDGCVGNASCESGPMAGVWTHPEVFGELTIVGGPETYGGSYTKLCEGTSSSRGYIRPLVRVPDGSDTFGATFDDGACRGKISNVRLSADGGQLHLDVSWEKRLSGPVSSQVILRRKVTPAG